MFILRLFALSRTARILLCALTAAPLVRYARPGERSEHKQAVRVLDLAGRLGYTHESKTFWVFSDLSKMFTCEQREWGSVHCCFLNLNTEVNFGLEVFREEKTHADAWVREASRVLAPVQRLGGNRCAEYEQKESSKTTRTTCVIPIRI